MKKRIIALLLVLCLALSVIAGCSGSAGQEKETLYSVGYDIAAENSEKYAFMDRDYAVTAADADTATAELEKAGAWLTAHVLESTADDNAFDFSIDGESFRAALSDWERNTAVSSENDTQTDYTVTYTKAGQPLSVVVEASAYKAFAIVEWTVYIKNTGAENSGVISDFYGINSAFGADCADSDFYFTRYYGSTYSNTAFSPDTKLLASGGSREFAAVGGKSSEYWSPYLNVQWKNENAAWGKEGVFVSIGWTGQWLAVVENTGAGFRVQAGQQTLATYLEPGESVRSPLMTLLFWEKDMMRSQNLWRRWVYNIAMPQPAGETVPCMLGANTADYTNLTETATTENQLAGMQLWSELGLEVDLWWMDAGWYTFAEGYNGWQGTGSWHPDPNRFENGSLASIGTAADEKDMKLIVWFEPERVCQTSEWGKKFAGTDWLIESYTGNYMLNLSKDEVLDFLSDYVISFMKENNIDCYRQDCNFADASCLKSYWEACDTEGRTGIVENKYIVNLMRYFDAINAAFPDGFIDCCATGGRRLDLEMIKRTVCLWRDDLCYDALTTQSQSYGINFFLPYSGQGTRETNEFFQKYTFRSNMMTFTNIPADMRGLKAGDPTLERWLSLMQEQRDYAPYMTQDYYPLTPFSDQNDTWMAWQFNDAAKGEGMIQVFKRVESTETSQTYFLSGLEPDTTYRLTDIDTGETAELTGTQLMCDGLIISIFTEMDAKIFAYAPVTDAQ